MDPADPIQQHPTFCVTRSPVPCGHHLAEPTVIEATAAGWDLLSDGPVVPRLEIAAALTRDGTPGVALTVVDPVTGRAVTAYLRHHEVAAAIIALTSQDRLADTP